MNAQPLSAGLHFDVPFQEYLSWPLLSQSVLKEGRASMSHLKAARDGARVKCATDDMLLGSALHCAFLEPEAMLKKVILWEGGRRYGKSWEAFQEEQNGKIILTEGHYENLVGMVQSLRRHPVVKHWTAHIEAVEVSAVGKIDGVALKGRCDALTPEPLVDLKKVATADPRVITKTVLNFGYHIQAFIYCRLFQRRRFLLICVEGSPPYDVVAYELSAAFLRQGEREAGELLARYKSCLQSGEWPGRSDDIVILEPPEWFGTKDEITIDGAAAFTEE
jgi:hypothetical protein